MTDKRPVIFRKRFMTISEINPIILLNGGNCIYIYSKTNDGRVSTSVPCLVNDKFYINGTYAI